MTDLAAYIRDRRWFGAKSREVTDARVLDSVAAEGLEIQLVEVGYPAGTHDVYQLLFERGEPVEPGEGRIGRELVHQIRSGQSLQAGEGIFEFRSVPGFAALGRELTEFRPVESEQSNSSVIVDDELILKVFRRLEAGVNPDLELLRFLTEHGFPNIAALGGWYAYAGRPLETTLGLVQEFVPGARDGWELALDELAEAPDRFLARLARLGEVTGALHTALGSDMTSPDFCPEEKTAEALGLLTATIDEEIERVFLDLPELDALEPIARRGEEIREQLRLLTHFGTAGRAIRTHGDFHLGQTLLDASDDWVLIDFEGEPARTLAERRRKRSPLRDVAGMLRSFAYAASAVESLRGVEPPSDWEARAREQFLDAYLESVDQTLLPPGREAIGRLLTIFELEKAVYELRYEVDNRPDWVGIPVAGIVRLLEVETPA